MNANDHVPMENIMPFGFCKKGMPCMPVTPLAWVDVNKKHIIDGAPALTEDSKLACFHGGVITIVPLDAGSAEEGDRNENAEDVVESIAGEALDIATGVFGFAASILSKGKIKPAGKIGVKKNSIKNNKGNGSNNVGNSSAANKSLENGIKASNKVEKTADEVNNWWKEEKGYDKPPYKPGTKVQEIELKEDTTFVRVYDDVNSYQKGGWVMKKEDIEGLSPEQIRDKFALPGVPKYVTDVKIPSGTKIRVGEANSVPGWGKGGGTQIDLMGQRGIGEIFSNPRPLK